MTQVRVGIYLTSPNEIFLGFNNSTGADPNFLILPLLVILATVIMAGLAVPLGPLLKSMPPLRAYTFDILGSMSGVALFTILSAAGTPPMVWFVALAMIASGLGLANGLSRASAVTAGSLAGVILVVVATSHQLRRGRRTTGSTSTALTGSRPSMSTASRTRRCGQQIYLPSARSTNRSIAGSLTRRSHACSLLELGRDRRRVALKHGAGHVDAVDIDPAIQAIGVREHPDHPYDDPRSRER